mgnify:CR=1 FL=1|tara:strand:+ start:420 stop:1061 length:642 start_codon:yes stop_codon:yes gene_type:complete
MKVKVKKEGKEKTYNFIESWSDVTLEKWMELRLKEDSTKTEEAEETIAALSDMPKKLIKQLSLRDVSIIMEKMSDLQKEQDGVLQKIVEIDGVQYGMHPDLQEITLGEYADIETLIKEGIQQNLPELMAILFRPITEKENDVYSIGAYDGNIKVRAEQMKKMSAEQVQSVLVFFWSFVRILLRVIPFCLINQTKEQVEKMKGKTLQTDGHGSE